MIWASRWSVALRTFYRQILSVLYSSFPFGNFRPQLVRALLVWYGTATSKRKWRFTGIRGHYWAQKPSGLLKVTSCCLRQLWLLLYTLLSTVASPVVHMHKNISILYLCMLHPFSSEMSGKKTTTKKKTDTPSAHATATARIGTKGSWFVGKIPANCWLNSMGGRQKIPQALNVTPVTLLEEGTPATKSISYIWCLDRSWPQFTL